MKTKIKFLFCLAILSFAIISCSDDQEQVVPSVRVEFSVNLTLPQFSGLNTVNNAIIYPNVGYDHNGVIVYRNSLDEFTAFDATCPQHIDNSTAVKLDDNGSGGQATCPYCKTVYYLYSYGASSKGYPLRRYNVTNSGGLLYINN